MGRPVKTETIVLWLCVALLAIAGLAPIAAIALESFRHNGHFSLNYYRELISAARFWPLLGNSVRLALATTAVCGLIGVPAGILFAKSDLPLRSWFIWLLTVPLVLPPYFVALGWARVVARIGAKRVRLAIRIRRLRPRAFVGLPSHHLALDVCVVVQCRSPSGGGGSARVGMAGSSSASYTATERSGDCVFARARVSPCDGRVERPEFSALPGIAGAEFYSIYRFV